ncbi:MAG: hypothetical protein H7099_19955 [Gemmatimonadaceae bacterium]|nr:hypothetical protein [Gemmatimonadaceae bacterium]
MAMQHLSPERIAALVDEPATHDERTHFEQCARCRADFVAVRRIVAAAASERDRPTAPLLSWQQLSTALHVDGVLAPQRSALVTPPSEIRPIASAPSLATPSSTSGHGFRGWQRVTGLAAAAAMLITVGVAGGRMTMGSATALGDPSPAIAAVQPAGPVSLAAQFRTPDEARASLHSAEEVYSGALLWLAAHDSAIAPRQIGGAQAAASDYRHRLEVLDAAMATARRALYEAPDDPVMNRYYLATLGAREVTLRRLTTVLPASQQVLEY